MHPSTLLLVLTTLTATTLGHPTNLAGRAHSHPQISQGTPDIPHAHSNHHHERSSNSPSGIGSGKKLVLKKKKRSQCVAKASGSLAGSSSSSIAAPMASSSSSTAIASAMTPSATSSSATTPSQASSVAVSSSATSASSQAPVASANVAATAPTSSGSRLFQLFPTGPGQADWSTCPDANTALSFTAALKPLTAGSLPKTSNAPDGTSALIANYPAGTVDYSSSTGHGFSFYSEGMHNGVNVEGAKEVLFSYSVFFQDGFNFVKGGKLPGVYGGTSLAQAKSCSGGRQNDRDQCFSARMMWRANGGGEFYNYYPTSIQQTGDYCHIAPYSVCDPVYGDSIGRGSFTFATGAWTTVAQRLKLNDIGQANGEQQLWVNGQSVLNLSGLQIATQQDTKIYGIMAQTFFGGNDASWASPKDQSAWFKDWSLAVLS